MSRIDAAEGGACNDDQKTNDNKNNNDDNDNNWCETERAQSSRQS